MYLVYSVNDNVVIKIKFYSILLYSILFYFSLRYDVLRICSNELSVYYDDTMCGKIVMKQ